MLFAQPGGGEKVPGTRGWIVAGGISVAVIVAAVVATRRGPRWWKAAMFGTAAAVSFVFAAALIKVVGDYAATDWVHLLTHWQTYALILFGLGGLFLAQNSFHAGPLAASQSALVLVDPLFSIIIGITLFGDSLRTSEPWGPLEAISLLVMFMGAVSLSHSPLVTGLKGDGKGADYEELLPRRARFGHSRAEASLSDGGLPRSPAPESSRDGDPLHDGADEAGEVVGVREVCPVLRTRDLVDRRSGHVGTQPGHRVAVMSRAGRCRPPRRGPARRGR